MPSSMLTMSVDKTQNVPIIVGNTSAFNISIKNISTTQRLYNLGLALTLPDGMVLSTATFNQTSTTSNLDNSTTYLWVNLKDLAPMELSFKFSITVKCNTKFKNGTTIPFGYTFSDINLGCQADTMPRGIYDINNEVIKQSLLMTYTTIRFSGTITTAEKVLKGAGTSASLNDYTQVATATCKFTNNSLSYSLVNITIILDDGIRYLGNLSASGTDASKLTSPTARIISKNGKLYTELYFGNINLSINSSTTLIFSYAVWNQYNNNTGGFIAHGTVLNMSINMASADPLIISSSYSSTSFSAMDLIITSSLNKPIVDVQNNVNYAYVYKVGQYYNIENILVHYFLPDGIYYISSSVTPTSVVDSHTLQGYYLTYNFPLATQNSSKSVTIVTKVDSYYRYKFNSQTMNLPVVASDTFLADADITGALIPILNQVSDSSNVRCSIGIGEITKSFIKGYYKDGTQKRISSLAPGDIAEYKLTYNASSLKAIQKEVYIDDFFPLSAGPIDNLSYEYSGVEPLSSPKLISPHGVDFYYGDISGLSSSTINFKVPVTLLGSSSENENLMKLKGLNTYGYAYSSRAQVNFNIGTPNLTLTKSIAGTNKNAIKANEIYTYTITISNSNNLGTETDAFDFTLNDTLSNWFNIDLNSIKVSGSGSYNAPIVQGTNISVYINNLSPGSYITLTYKVTISSVLASGVSITTTATNTNPYSQVYNPLSTNFQYSGLNKSASVTVASLPIKFTITNYNDTFMVGSPITYVVTVTVPQGTIAYGFYLKTTLPTDGQIYLGPSYKNGANIAPVVSSNVITFPIESTLDARLEALTITYIFTCKIINANKSLNDITSLQITTLQCWYQKIHEGSFTILSKSFAIIINHPNLVMNLSATDKTTSTVYNETANINTNAIMQFKLIFQNNSAISLVNGTIEIPISNNFLFSSIDASVLCNATYNSSSKKIVITISALASALSGYVTFTLLPKADLKAGTTINTQATAVSYYNNISPTKLYSGEKSNVLSCILPPGVSLNPNPLYALDQSTSFIVTPPGGIAEILTYFKNTGGGYDDFTLTIQKVAISYTLYIDDIKIADIFKNTLYSADLPLMSSLAPGTSKIIKIVAVIPSSQALGVRYDFTVTVKSKTSPYPEKTVLNIDPY
ncbi:isopeptide-forming domain-containing fimbrial protein [Clostridium folliculivorans]|uniref:Isopeptide-forming domain-containing fimbrial protein n=1 Tax=Clostridium folliculivorans TaxID=2886038 RepID=A0A9W5Y203_9CLOT|nr:isopeptide-forming domain-containing fimbrial protein [Clostridium folliculivorans]GKU25136.1 hypothetical protein CFOLD11_19620 [Clostridium folliculivorans]GKU31234.1 hypothetical protein CFB3_33410 [Clostridium folliculivorans]